MTVRDKLRSLTDEQLAVLIAKYADGRCKFCVHDGECRNPYTGECCKQGIAEWLKSEAKE